MAGPEKSANCCTPERDQKAALPAAQSTFADDKSASPQDGIVAIPGGVSYLGTDSPIILADEEAPLRKGKIKPFWMDEAAVTNKRFRAFVEATGYITDAEHYGDSLVFEGLLADDAPPSNAVAAVPWWRAIPKAMWSRPEGEGSSIEGRDDHPVVHVSWRDAQAFAKWANGRLPREDEWEHAARAGLIDPRYPWGDDDPNDSDHFPCNIWQGQFPNHNTSKDGHYGTASAISFSPNAYGLYNMVGNTWEWTAQEFRVRSLKKAIKETHQGKDGFKIVKGGSFLCHDSYCFRYRIAARTANSPESSTSHMSFRLVYDNLLSS